MLKENSKVKVHLYSGKNEIKTRNGEKPKNRLEIATENFVAVRDYFLNKDRGTSRAFRLAWEKPMKFYHEHTPAEAVEILKREAEKKQNENNI